MFRFETLDIAIRSIFETIYGLTVAYKKGLIKEPLYRELYNEGEILAKRIRTFRSTLNS
ncbi:four helix bundle protein [Candidatus Uhrbacteria bacterium]|nr:four helix bundle protein [Candidatus Uhrbacteria bacterium]